MKSKIIGLIIGIVVLGGLMITSFLDSTQQIQQPLTIPSGTTTKSITATATVTPPTSTTQTVQQTPPRPPVSAPSSNPAPNTNNLGIPTPPPIASYTSVEVAAHADKTSCWSIVNDSVYDLTNWISKHPGGQGEILAMCGKDATAAFEGQHGGDSKPERILGSYFIGVLIN